MANRHYGPQVGDQVLYLKKRWRIHEKLPSGTLVLRSGWWLFGHVVFVDPEWCVHPMVIDQLGIAERPRSFTRWYVGSGHDPLSSV